MANSPNILETHLLSKKYHDQFALRDVSIHVARGDIYGLIGRNGAGKTTLMKVVAGLARPTSGSVEINETGDGGPRGCIGALIEEPGIYPDMTALQNLHAKCIAYGICDKSVERDLLELVGLAYTGKKPAGKFSLGMRQRLGIALSMVGDPSLVILDEPINGLDPQGIAEVREMIELLNRERGTTFVISSHILGELSRFATRYGVIHRGELIQELSREEMVARSNRGIVLKTPNYEAAASALSDLGIGDFSEMPDGSIEIRERTDDVAGINRALVLSGVAVEGIYLANVGLEDYYLSLTGGKNDA